MEGDTIKGSNSVIFIFASIFHEGQLLRKEFALIRANYFIYTAFGRRFSLMEANGKSHELFPFIKRGILIHLETNDIASH